jgi:DNA-binding transcriptional regulator LsrR (DeoR family)
MVERKRNDQESRDFKARMEDLKRHGRSDAEIARELGVTRQYVSQVLTQAGLAGRRRRFVPVKSQATTNEVIELMARLEQQGQLGLAYKLRELVDRRKKVKRRPGEGKQTDNRADYS